MFQQRLEKHYRLRDSKLAEGSLRLSTDTKKNKQRVDYEPRSAHDRAVKNTWLKYRKWENLSNFAVPIFAPPFYFRNKRLSKKQNMSPKQEN